MPKFLDGEKHDAMPSWSGYVYQGEIAIYTCLCIINNCNFVITDWSTYELEIESLEDFSIKINGEYHSIHQVKAYGSNNLSKYTKPILGLLGKTARYKTIVSANLHTVNQIQNLDRDTIKSSLEMSIYSKNPHSYYHELLFKQGEFDYTFYRFNNNPQFETVIGLQDVRKKIEEQILKFYLNCTDPSGDIYNKAKENINYIFHKFLGKISEHVSKRHIEIMESATSKDNQDAIKVPIRFDEIIAILNEDSIFEFCSETSRYLLTKKIFNALDEYCSLNDIKATDLKYIDLKTQIEKFHLLFTDEFILLCRKITPH